MLKINWGKAEGILYGNPLGNQLHELRVIQTITVLTTRSWVDRIDKNLLANPIKDCVHIYNQFNFHTHIENELRYP